MVSFWSSPTTKDAYWLSWISLICTIIAASIGISLFAKTGSSLCLVYGLENCVDFLSSAVVLWRFFAPSDVDSELEQKLNRREKRASVLISFILVLLGINVISTALSDFARGEEDAEGQRDVIRISVLSIFVFAALTCFKFKYAKVLESASLNKDGICSMIGTILAVALFINTLIIKQKSSLWWLDPVVAMGCGIGAICYGIKCVRDARVREKLPIFTLSWWFLSQGNGTDESSGRSQGPESFPKMVDGDVEMKEGAPPRDEKEDEGEIV